nr:hypothetical protein Pfo_016585 [Paulownia fortunei]
MATETTPPSKPSPDLSSTNPATPTVDIPPPSATTPAPTPSTSAATPATVTPRLPEPEADVVHIPSYSRWFSWNGVHECEARFVPEFFDGRSSSKNPRAYKYYRNAIIRRFRENPNRKITFTEVRKTIVGDVGSIRRVFDFLEAWGLINYAGSTKPQLKWEDKETKSTAACYVRGNYRVGLSSSDFKRVEISEEAKTDWTDKETLQLLEAIMHYGADWKKVAEHVGGRSVKECVARFIKLPFGEQFDGPPESADLDTELGLQNVAIPTKRLHLSPLADASNPIMAQAAFLSTLVGVDVAEVAARAAVTALSDLGDRKQQVFPLIDIYMYAYPIFAKKKKNKEENGSDNASNGNSLNMMEEALDEAKLQLEKEEEGLEKAISGISTQTKEIEDKILHFEEFELEMERKLQQFQQLQNQLFVDQLTILFHKTAAPKTGDNVGEAVKSE